MESFFALLALCIAMFFGSFLAGYVPLKIKMSERHMNLLSVFGAGLLVGTALIVIIPEGIHMWYAADGSMAHAHAHEHEHEHAAATTSLVEAGQVAAETVARMLHMTEEQAEEAEAAGPGESSAGSSSEEAHGEGSGGHADHKAIGASLACGFAFMLLIDTLGEGHGHGHAHAHSGHGDERAHSHSHGGHEHEHEHGHSHSHGDVEAGKEEDGELIAGRSGPGSGAGSGVGALAVATPRTPAAIAAAAAAAAAAAGACDGDDGAAGDDTKPLVAGGSSSSSSGSSGSGGSAKNSGRSVALGLLVHAAVDGVALGAAAAAGQGSVEMLVFVAIMLHKAPAAFGLTSYLVHHGVSKEDATRQLLTFSLAAPLMALVTYYCLNLGLISSSRKSLAVCFMFSGGTFLYVSAAHILPEIRAAEAANTSATSRRDKFVNMWVLVFGILLPLLISVEHEH